MATLLQDNFDRADSTTVVGSPQTGPAPVVQAGVGGISGNRLYASTLPVTVTYDLGTPNVELSFLGANLTSALDSVILGYASATDFYQVAFQQAQAVVLYRATAGGTATLASSSVKMPVSGTSVCKAHYKDGIIRAYVDGVLVLRYVLDTPITANLHGVRISTSGGGRIDDLLGVDAPTIAENPVNGATPVDTAVGISTPPFASPSFAYLGRDTKLQDISEGA
jgi:hypothetical protein